MRAMHEPKSSDNLSCTLITDTTHVGDSLLDGQRGRFK